MSERIQSDAVPVEQQCDHPSANFDAADIVRAIRAQNWKNGGALVLDDDEAILMVELYAERALLERELQIARAALATASG